MSNGTAPMKILVDADAYTAFLENIKSPIEVIQSGDLFLLYFMHIKVYN